MLAVVVILVTYALLLQHYFPDYEVRGQFGDMFGTLNAAFSGLAFTAIVYAIFLQRQDLEYQRKELELAREEYKRMADAHVATYRINVLAQRIQATRYAFEAGQSALAEIKKRPPSEETQMWIANMEMMLFAQAQRMGELIQELEKMEKTFAGDDDQSDDTGSAVASYPPKQA
jgi:hypothetical protein